MRARNLKIISEPPVEKRVENPDAYHVTSQILEASASYWQGGCCDAGLWCRNSRGEHISQIIFLFRENHGFFVQFFKGSSPSAYVLCNESGDTSEVELTHGGAPWTLKQKWLVEPSTAAKAIGQFVEERSGKRPAGNWEPM